MNILLVEDDQLFAIEVERLIDSMGYRMIGKVDTGEKALEIAERELPDLLLADIRLQGALSGLDVARELTKKEVPVIFFTSYASKEVYDEVLAHVPSAFLKKPFSLENLKSAIDLALLKVKNRNSELEEPRIKKTGMLFNNAFFIKDKSILHKVPVDDIFMIEAEGNYCTVFTPKKRFVLKNSLKKLYAQLPQETFSQVHRNYVVQLEEIEKVDMQANSILIKEKVIPVGRKYWTILIKKLRVL